MPTQNNHIELLPQDYDGIREGENMPKVYEVNDITAIDPAILTNLRNGDTVVKITGKQRHSYEVSYKGDGVGEGLCLTYTDASLVETVSYDFTAEGWEYNSTDQTPIANVLNTSEEE